MLKNSSFEHLFSSLFLSFAMMIKMTLHYRRHQCWGCLAGDWVVCVVAVICGTRVLLLIIDQSL